jgi:hypothetical protein
LAYNHQWLETSTLVLAPSAKDQILYLAHDCLQIKYLGPTPEKSLDPTFATCVILMPKPHINSLLTAHFPEKYGTTSLRLSISKPSGMGQISLNALTIDRIENAAIYIFFHWLLGQSG